MAVTQTLQIDKLLQTVVNQKASDLHIASGQPPVLHPSPASGCPHPTAPPRRLHRSQSVGMTSRNLSPRAHHGPAA